MQQGNILIIHQGAIGDFVLSLPALQTITGAFPGCGVEMLGYPATLALAGSLAAGIRSVDQGGLSSLYGDFADISSRARQYLGGFERIFIFSAQQHSAFIENVQRCHAAILHIRTFPDRPCHVIDFQLAQLLQAGFAPAGPLPRLFASSDDDKRAEQFFRENIFAEDSGPFIAVHPGSGGRQKNWPAASFLHVLRQLHEQRKAFFLIVQGPAEEQTAVELQAGLAGLPHSILKNLDLPLVAALLSRCSLFIGNDSGITHLAAALGVPTVAVFGPTDPFVWGPRGKSVHVIRQWDKDGQWRWPEPREVLRQAGPGRVDKELPLK